MSYQIELKKPFSACQMDMLLIFVPVFFVYLWSVPPTVVFEDDGLFLLSAYFNGISHPPGYPLYTLLAHLVTLLPGNSVAFKVHALSALFGALTCCCVYLLAYQMINNRVAASMAALAYGWSEVFWSQSIIAEVYSLNAFLFFLMLTLVMQFRRAPEHAVWLSRGIALCFGLGLSNHWPLFVLSSPLLIAMIWPWDRSRIILLIKAIPFLLVGLLPYLWMVIRSQMDPVISFYGPIDSLYKLWFVISRAGYAEVDTSSTATWIDKYEFAVYFFRQFSSQYGLPGMLLVITGFVSQWRQWPLSLVIGYGLAFLCNSLVLIGMLGFDFDVLHQYIFRVYPTIAYGIASLWLGLGFHSVINFIHARKNSVIGDQTVVYALALLVLVTELLTNIPLNYRGADTWSEKYAHAVLDNLEPNAVLFTSGDSTTDPIGYLNLVEHVRPDVTLYNSLGLVLSNRLYSFSESEQGRRRIIDHFIEHTNRPVYFMGELPTSYGNFFQGLFLKINKDKNRKNTVYQINAHLLDDILQLIAVPEPADHWQSLMHQMLTLDYCQLSAFFILPTLTPESLGDTWVEPLCKTYLGYLKYAEMLLNLENPDSRILDFLLIRAESLQKYALSKKDRAMVEYYRGLFYMSNGDKLNASQFFQRALSTWPHPDNPASNTHKN